MQTIEDNMSDIKHNTNLLCEASKTEKSENSYALQCALHHNRIECFESLYPVSDPIDALTTLQNLHPDDVQLWGVLKERVDADEAKRLRSVLSNEVGESVHVHKKTSPKCSPTSYVIVDFVLSMLRVASISVCCTMDKTQ